MINIKPAINILYSAKKRGDQTMSYDIGNVLLDLNGCVMGPPSKEFYEGLWELAQIAELTKQEKAPFILGACTGREMQYARAALHIIGSPRGISICESGLGIFDVENEIWTPHPRTNELKPLFEKEISKIVVSRIMASHPGDLRLYVGNMLNIAIELTPQAKITIEALHEETGRELQEFVLKGMVKLHHSKDAEDITAFDKGDGIVQVEEKTGISRSRTLGIGDSDGDEPLLKTVEFIGCPDNASEACKALVRQKEKEGKGRISPYKHSKGVTDIIQYFTGVKIS